MKLFRGKQCERSRQPGRAAQRLFASQRKNNNKAGGAMTSPPPAAVACGEVGAASITGAEARFAPQDSREQQLQRTVVAAQDLGCPT